MKYAIIKVINGNFFIHAEGFTDLKNAKISYHGLCQVLWNADDVKTAYVMVVDENLNCMEDFREWIYKPEPEPEPEPDEITE